MASGLTEALVWGVEDEGRVLVRLAAKGSSPAARWAARNGVQSYQPSVGDRVLVQFTTGGEQAYVVGVVHAARAPELATPSGATASAEGDLIALRNAAGTLLATLDGRSGELALRADADLRLSAPAGSVRIEAAEALSLTASRGELDVGDLSARTDRTRWITGLWDLRTERLVERSKEAYRTVTGLLETRAKRLRTLVATTLELRGRRTTVASEKDTRIDGKRVLLG